MDSHSPPGLLAVEYPKAPWAGPPNIKFIELVLKLFFFSNVTLFTIIYMQMTSKFLFLFRRIELKLPQPCAKELNR